MPNLKISMTSGSNEVNTQVRDMYVGGHVLRLKAVKPQKGYL